MNQILAVKVKSVLQFISKPLCRVLFSIKEFNEYSYGIKTHTACTHDDDDDDDDDDDNNNNNNNNNNNYAA